MFLFRPIIKCRRRLTLPRLNLLLEPPPPTMTIPPNTLLSPPPTLYPWCRRHSILAAHLPSTSTLHSQPPPRSRVLRISKTDLQLRRIAHKHTKRPSPQQTKTMCRHPVIDSDSESLVVEGERLPNRNEFCSCLLGMFYIFACSFVLLTTRCLSQARYCVPLRYRLNVTRDAATLERDSVVITTLRRPPTRTAPTSSVDVFGHVERNLFDAGLLGIDAG